MRFLLNLAWVLFWISPMYAQTNPVIDQIIQTAHHIETMTYTSPKESTDSTLFIKMAFEEYNIYNLTALKEVKLGKVSRIDIIYTLYPFGKKFPKLHYNRIQAILEVFPNLVKSKDIEWRLVGQSQGKNRQSAVQMFHGAAIYYQPISPPALVVQEKQDSITYTLREIRDDPPPSKMPSPVKTVLNPINAETANYASDLGLKTILEQEYVPEDSSVYQVIERNADEWEKVLVVADWTGSMYPYGMQLMVWLKQHAESRPNFQHFVFFNDGDQKSLGEKVIGYTGGIYASPSAGFDDVLNTMLKTQAGGLGGDSPENDVEAMLVAQSYCQDCQEIVLIAEAESQVRDMLLLRQLVDRCKARGQRVRVILCGPGNINEDYIAIAAATGGSLHTAQEDVKGLDQLKIGDRIELNGLVYEFASEGLRFIEKKPKFKKK